jgi:co-chaperonin GroES (HSP10)
MNLRPLSDRLVILPDEPLDHSPSGIFFPNVLGKRGAPETGLVVAVGPGSMSEEDGTRTPVAAKKGQRVIFKRLSGFDHKASGKVFYICREQEILGIVG